MASSGVSTLVPVLVPVVVKLIDRLFSSGETITPPEIKDKRRREGRYCECRGEPSTRYNVKNCTMCGRSYTESNTSNGLYLDMPTYRERSVSSGNSPENCDKSEKRYNRKACGSSYSCPKRVSNEDTLTELGRLLKKENIKDNRGSSRKVISLDHDFKSSTMKPGVFKCCRCSSKRTLEIYK